jgi:hypothetical protein
MHTHLFSGAQAAHALEVVLTLMKERRFFLFQQEDYSRKIEGDLGHGVHFKIFEPALKLDGEIRAIYTEATLKAERIITEGEHQWNIAPAELTNKRLVQCNRYTGGLDICRVYPTTAFTELAPASVDELQARETVRLLGGKTVDDLSPKELRELQERARTNASLIWKELADIKAVASGNSCVVLLKTRFEPIDGYKEDDFLQGRLTSIPLFPHAMGYLFYEYSKQTRIVRHAQVVFNTSRKLHVNVQHWTSGELSLGFDKEGGYSCKVYIPIVL